MTRSMSFVFLAVFALVGQSSTASAEDKTNCEPQPNCRLKFIVIKPGAPTPGLNSQTRGLDTKGVILMDAGRESYRLPSAKTM